MQALEAVLPAGDIVPAEQEPQTLESVNVLDWAPARAYFPSGHVMVPVQDEDVSPVVEPYVPARQLEQVVRPIALLYVPAEQIVHPLAIPPVYVTEFPEYPAAHVKHCVAPPIAVVE